MRSRTRPLPSVSWLALSLIAALSSAAHAQTLPEIGLAEDPAPAEVSGAFRPGSHVKLYLPNLPYLAISHAVNASLVRPANNERGWGYDLAVGHQNDGDQVWTFQLRRDVRFQDGSPFNADTVIRNMAAFSKAPFTFTKLHTILERVEKLDDHTVRFHLAEPYGVFLHDALWLVFYTDDYLTKFGWRGKPTCPNLAEPGPYALGPYMLVEGYLEGDRSSPKVVLRANPNYWGEQTAKVETITIFTSLDLDEAVDRALHQEGRLDITPLPFADQVETVLSPHAKLVMSPSLNNYAMHFNMLNGDPAIKDERIRFVFNQAIDQEALLNLSMLGAGSSSPTMVSPNFYRVRNAIDSLEGFFTDYARTHDTSPEALRKIVHTYQREQGLDPDKPLKLRVVAQRSFSFLLNDIRHFLAGVNIELEIELLPAEKDVFLELFATWKDENQYRWDLLLWGNYDWYKHPWAAFFVYRPYYDWSTIPRNDEMAKLTAEVVRINPQSDAYVPVLAKFIRHVYERNYMVFLPTPHNVYAVNKEVVFNPGRSAFVYLRDLEVTDLHWSLRGDARYPEARKRPLKILRRNFQVQGK